MKRIGLTAVQVEAVLAAPGYVVPTPAFSRPEPAFNAHGSVDMRPIRVSFRETTNAVLVVTVTLLGVRRS